MVTLGPSSSSFCDGLSATTVPSNIKAQPVPVRILSVGVAALDFVASVDHFPEPDGKMRSNSLLVEGGGNAANTACAIARLAPYVDDSTLVTALGNDSNGKTILGGLSKMNVNVVADSYDGSSPFTYIITTDDEKNGGNTRTCIHQPGSGELSVDFVTSTNYDDNNIDNKNDHNKSNADLLSLLEKCTAVHFDARYPEAAITLAKKCIKLGIPYSIDVERPREGLDELMKGAAIIVCNSRYCNIVENIKNEDDSNIGETLFRLRRVMRKKAPKAKLAVQTLGAKGCCLVRLASDDDENNNFSNTNGSEDDTKSRDKKADDVTNSQSGVAVLLQDGEEKNNGDNTFAGAPTVTAFNIGGNTSASGALVCSAFTNCNVVDTTGAGDAFIGGFLTAIWSHYNAAACVSSLPHDNENNDSNKEQQQEAILSATSDKVLARVLRIATRVATKKIEKPGARSGLPFVTDDSFLQSEFRAMLR